MIDDLASNLLPAKQVGIKTVLFGQDKKTDEADYIIKDISEIAGLINAI